MTKYKKGDKVRCISVNEWVVRSGIHVGDINNVSIVSSNHIKIKGNDNLWLFDGCFKLEGLTELQTWHREFPHLKSHIREVMKHE